MYSLKKLTLRGGSKRKIRKLNQGVDAANIMVLITKWKATIANESESPGE